MARDHYVAQTYLKHFRTNGRRVNAIRKSELKFLKAVKVDEICQLSNWCDSPYHQPNPRIVEDYLRVFEPHWNQCIKTLRRNSFDIKTKNYMAGYLAFLRACTPKAVRLSEHNLEEVVKMTYDILAAQELAKKTKHAEIIKKIETTGGVKVNVDHGYSKGMTFRGIINLTEKYVGFEWTVLFNQTHTPFLTSDNPVCIERLTATYCKFYVPLTPSIGLIIYPSWPGRENEEPRQKKDEFCDIEEKGVHLLNELLVKNAEDMVIFNDDNYEWVMDLVSKYRHWRVESRKTRLPTEGGYLLIAQEMVVDKALENVAPRPEDETITK